MTEQTQTTDQRILRMLSRPFVTNVAEAIAAEIDALTAQRDALVDDRAVANRETDALKAQLAEARAELQHTTNEFAVILRERNDAHLALATRTQERDAALALIGSHHKARNAALAEVERLRPAAEAWEAWREYDEIVASMPLTRDTDQEQAVQDAATKRSAAYARARAAKEAKP